MSLPPSSSMPHVVSARSCRRRKFLYLLAAVVAACGLFVGERDAEAQYALNFDQSREPWLYVSVVMLSGLAITPLTLDIVQGVQLARRGHTSLGVTVPSLVFSTLELTFGALIIGDFSQSAIPDGPWVAISISAVVHAASSIAWSIYGITRTRPPVGTTSPARTDRTIILPAPTLLRMPSGTAPLASHSLVMPVGHRSFVQ